MLFYVYATNLIIMMFNLIPIPPLDGSKVLFALLPNKAYRFVLAYERYGMLILMGLLFFTRVLDVPLLAASGFFTGVFFDSLSNVINLVRG
jgi:Zn-dependent protease